jgi:NhaP-type Na+/H+ or K+/H+ antiporter
MKLRDFIFHPRRWKDIFDALNTFKAKWRSPDMTKLSQREFLLPIVSAVGVALANFFGYEMTTEEIGSIGGLVATSIAGMAARKRFIGVNGGIKKLAEREFWVPLFAQGLIFANNIWGLDMSEKTIFWIAGTAAAATAGAFIRKKVAASSPPTVTPR